ncbi:hypothetical protein V8E36_008356 [Tilletia maclaganii]
MAVKDCRWQAHNHKANPAAHQWGVDWGMRFDSGKRELAHFVDRHYAAEWPPTAELLDGSVNAVPADDSFRWLGVLLDSRLSFHAHVKAAAERGRKAAGAMTMLMNTRKGMRVIIGYAAAAWWRGLSRLEPGRPHRQRKRQEDGSMAIPPPDPPTTKRNDGAKLQAKLLDSVQHLALGRALPAYRTTPKAALQVEASCPPIDIFLDMVLDMAALRLATLDDHHPLLRRVDICWSGIVPCPNHSASRAHPPLVQRCAERRAVHRPFSTRLDHLAARVPQHIERPTPPAQKLCLLEQVQFDDFTLPPAAPLPQDDDAIHVYTDGSRVEQSGAALTGAGWVIMRGTEVLERHCAHTGSSREVFDAEAVGLARGIIAGLRTAELLCIKLVISHTDNQAVLLALRDMSMRSSFADFNYLSIWASTFLSLSPDTRIIVRWIKGHAGHEGNELEDAEAERGASDPHLRPTYHAHEAGPADDLVSLADADDTDDDEDE